MNWYVILGIIVAIAIVAVIVGGKKKCNCANGAAQPQLPTQGGAAPASNATLLPTSSVYRTV